MAPKSRVRSPGRLERKRLGAREWQPRWSRSATVRPGSSSEAPAGGEAGQRGRRCSARSGGLGELCPPVPKARTGTRQLGRCASSRTGRGGAQPGVGGAGSGPKSSQAPCWGGPRRSPVPRASAAATAAAPARPRGGVPGRWARPGNPILGPPPARPPGSPPASAAAAAAAASRL